MQGEGAEPGKETEERQQMIRSASARVDGMEWVSAVWCGVVGYALGWDCWGSAGELPGMMIRLACVSKHKHNKNARNDAS